MLSAKNRFIELDALRGICAIITLIYHYAAYIYGPNTGDNRILDITEYGKYGVYFFFVISGFVIFMTLERSSGSKHFLISRFSRLYPAYWVCLIITALVINISPYSNYHPVTLLQFIANLTMFQHWVSIEDIDGVYWTLAVELCFYLFIYIVFIARRQKNIEWIGVVWLAIMAAVYYIVPRSALHYYYYYIPLLRAGDLFFCGILFYQLKQDITKKRIYILLLLTLLVHFLLNPLQESLVIAFIYIIMFLFVTDRLKTLRSKTLFFFGTISYTLYLLHQYIGYEIINYLTVCQIENTFIKILITSVLIILLASIVTFLVERPAMKFIRRRFMNIVGSEKAEI